MSFVWHSLVFFDELDLNGTLHNARFAVHVERAQSALFEQLGKTWSRIEERDPDLHYVVREFRIEFLAPCTAPGPLRVELTGERLGSSSAVYGFRIGADGACARGERAIVKLDPATGEPSPWSAWYRELFDSALLTPP